jgi:hypothetical protein
MATWAGQRKFLYASVVIAIIAVFIGIPVFISTYEKPTCFDNILNNNEEGIDCGGSCARLCQSAFLPPAVQWTKIEKVADGLFNVAAYIINPNTNGTAINVPYLYSLYDKNGELVITTKGETTLPAHRNTIAFVGAVNTSKRTPTRAVFEFIMPPHWQKSHDTLGDLTITDKKYTEDSTSSSLEVTITNRALTPYSNIYIFAVLYDGNNNAIGFSRTRIDTIDPRASVIAPFTWPTTRNGAVTSIEILPVTPPVIDAQ